MIADTSQSKHRRLTRGRHGTLGVDIGSSAIKMVRMEWVSGRWSITNRLILPIDEPLLNPAHDLESGFLRRQLDILQRRTLSSSHECSCVLPMSVTDIRSVEVPHGADKDVLKMATESLRDCFGLEFEERTTKLWRHSETPHDLAMVSGVSVRTSLGERIVDDLNTVGLDCTSMTSLPFALAHAASMSPVGRTQQPIGLLSWEHSTTTFVVAHHGRPEFIRTLRDCSGKAVNERLADGLGLNADEARSVLATFGLPGQQSSSSSVCQAVDHLIQPEIQKVGSELQKTLMYLRHHLPKLLPARLVLFGGMATVPNIATALETACGLETKPWTMNADNSHFTDPIFAPAIAVSVGGGA